MMEQLNTKSADTIPIRKPNESETDYFRRLLKWSGKVKEAVLLHDRWKRHHLNGISVPDCLHRVQVVLDKLLRSDFLRSDWFDTGIPGNDREHAVRELREKGYDELLRNEDADWKFAVLSQLLRTGEKRIIIEEHNAGFYISEMYDRLNHDDVVLFFQSITIIRLAYKEIDRLKKAETDYAFNECLSLMLIDLKPLKKHITEKYTDCFDTLIDEIFKIGQLRETLKNISPTTFKGGYNQKLACNLVGLLCSQGVFKLNPRQADNLIYPGKTHYSYINYYVGPGTSSELNQDDIKDIKKLLINNPPDL